MPAPTVILIAAVSRNGGIGKDNQLLARLPEDLAHFRRTTLGSAILMGRKTWDSIGRPLPGRRNVVLTRDAAWHAEGVERAPSFESALALLRHEPRVFVIGGGQVFVEVLPRADQLVLTEIDADLEADSLFPAWDRSAFRAGAQQAHRGPQGLDYTITTYTRI